MAGGGKDVIHGGPGDDTLIGGANDTMNGNAGDDSIIMQSGVEPFAPAPAVVAASDDGIDDSILKTISTDTIVAP